MSANRMHFRNSIHFITNRCEHEMLLLLPKGRITEIIQGWFARSFCLHGKGLEIFAFVFLSNHFHLLVKDTQGTLAAFMWYFQGNVAKAVNREQRNNTTANKLPRLALIVFLGLPFWREHST